MDVCIDHILFLQQSAEDQYTAKVKRVGFRYNQNYDEGMCMLAKLATHHAYNLVEEQYLVSGEETYDTTTVENTPAFFTLASAKSGGQYAVNLTEHTCSCAFNQTMLLSCRHILYLRLNANMRSIIPYEAIPGRWLLADEDEEVVVSIENT
ncbi:hypothetical protein L914_03316 [Phytophthora nicotianae]|uniref:SWIM-type domain-containing protein n=2 Tax=Phytophthora nicotianae TaxID=4792 RepID=V9FRB4_PHYNI|nr:hypothetical protein F443_03471 [Phytophthora nicotianae P1569]ETM53191.1 hypothetical protein L914_03319 [Phytophthora nicotianae]ETM53195.1 hypothetical protein L914_03316 [Phytophthora nicotianae]